MKSSTQKSINNGNTSKMASRLSPISRGNRTNPSIFIQFMIHCIFQKGLSVGENESRADLS